MTDIKHDAKWLHSNGFDSKEIGNIRGAIAAVEGINPLPFSSATEDGRNAQFLYELVGKLALLLNKQEDL